MRARDGSWLFSVPALLGAGAMGFVACGPPPPPEPPGGAGAGSPVGSSPDGVSSGPEGGGGSSTLPGMTPPDTTGAPLPECRLSEPKKSADTCRTDADCGVSDPCHARECVAKSRSHPPDARTICTQIMDCYSADRNPCLCFEGMCTLVPPKE